MIGDVTQEQIYRLAVEIRDDCDKLAKSVDELHAMARSLNAELSLMRAETAILSQQVIQAP